MLQVRDAIKNSITAIFVLQLIVTSTIKALGYSFSTASMHFSVPLHIVTATMDSSVNIFVALLLYYFGL